MSVWCIYLNLCNIINGMIKRYTDCSIINLIFIRLASQLYYSEFKNIYIWQNILIWILTNGFNSQNMIKITGAILPPYIFI